MSKAAAKTKAKPVAKKAPARAQRAQPVPRKPKAQPAAPNARLAKIHNSKKPNAEELKANDEGYQLARSNAARFLHSRRQAVFSVARHYHLDADDLQQEAYEVLLTCLRDFNPVFTKASGDVVTVQFNTFFGNRLEGKALEMRNRDPEYQARQAHMQDMSDGDKASFRENPPLLVQHLDQETAMQEHLQSQVSSAQRSRQTNLRLKIAQESFVERKLNDLIAAERDDKRRAALQHIKVGGVSSFDEIAYHFGVTDSRASQILNELMDAFYVQRLLDADLKSVVYDFRKQSIQEKRAQRLLEEAMRVAPLPRANAIVEAFAADFPQLKNILAALPSTPTRVTAQQQPEESHVVAAPAQLTAEEETQFPLQQVEVRTLTTLTSLGVSFRPSSATAPENLLHIKQLAAHAPENWPPLIITPEGAVIDGERRIAAALAMGVDRLACQVRTNPGVKESQQLRVCLNSRTRPLDKHELYFAIVALLALGLSQGKVAEALGTSRPNVIVYAKVHNSCTPRMRSLFEDGLIQITNASSAADLSAKAQDDMADFIRQHGATWGRGPQFNELYEAAAAGNIAHLTPATNLPGFNGGAAPSARPLPAASAPSSGASFAPPAHLTAVTPFSTQNQAHAASATLTNALKKRQEALEHALRDAETWARQREATITSQTSQINELKQGVESLKRELEAHSLMSQADEATLASYIKDIKHFYAIQERLAGAAHQLSKAHSQLRSSPLTHRQSIEVEELLDQIATHHSALRIALLKRP